MFLLDLGGEGNLPLRTLPTLGPGEPTPVPVVRLPELALAVTPALPTEAPLAPKEFRVLFGPPSLVMGALACPTPVFGVPGLERSSTEVRSRSPRSERWSHAGLTVEVGFSLPCDLTCNLSADGLRGPRGVVISLRGRRVGAPGEPPCIGLSDR